MCDKAASKSKSINEHSSIVMLFQKIVLWYPLLYDFRIDFVSQFNDSAKGKVPLTLLYCYKKLGQLKPWSRKNYCY